MAQLKGSILKIDATFLLSPGIVIESRLAAIRGAEQTPASTRHERPYQAVCLGSYKSRKVLCSTSGSGQDSVTRHRKLRP
jgi:hypothetical protein